MRRPRTDGESADHGRGQRPPNHRAPQRFTRLSSLRAAYLHVAKNAAMVELIRTGFECEVLVPEEAQTVGALGAALSHGAGAHE